MKYFIFAFTFFMLFPSVASADYNASDKSISGVIEIDPGADKPVAGKDLLLRFIFTDNNEQFKLKDCTCFLTITQPERVPYRQQLQVVGADFAPHDTDIVLNSIGIPYRFPTEGTYTLTVTGSPAERNTFEPFTLTWEIPLTGTPETAPPVLQKSQHASPQNQHWLWAGGVIILIGGIIYFIHAHKQTRTAQIKKDDTSQ